jgi:hypothetical protein
MLSKEEGVPTFFKSYLNSYCARWMREEKRGKGKTKQKEGIGKFRRGSV